MTSIRVYSILAQLISDSRLCRYFGDSAKFFFRHRYFSFLLLLVLKTVSCEILRLNCQRSRFKTPFYSPTPSRPQMANVKLVPTFNGKISFDHILLAHERIRHYLHTTPVFQNEALNGLCRTDDWPMAISCKGASSKAAALSARLRLVYAR